MKKLVAKLFIAFLVVGGIPGLGLAKTNPLTETPAESSSMTNAGRFRVYAYSFQNHSIYLNPGYISVVLSGDGDTDLDLYIYDSTGLIGKAEGNSDDEVLNITIRRADYFVIKVVNRGKVYNDYVLAVQ